jgi:hypothetical protein
MLRGFFIDRHKQVIVWLLIALLGSIFLLSACAGQSTLSTGKSGQQVSSPTPGGDMKVTVNPNLSAYPKEWIPGTQGWIPPLPPGLDEPWILTQEEWNKVTEIARADHEVTIQTGNNNIDNLVHYWVGYSGGPGFDAETDSDIISGKVNPPEGNWYYPAIMFLYVSRTERNGQLVAVDLTTKQIVLSEGSGFNVPTKPYPHHPT